MFEKVRTSLASFIAPQKPKSVPALKRVRAKKPSVPVRAPRPVDLTRMYAAAKASRLTQGWGQLTTSEDAELSSSLRTLRNRSRELCRDSAYAKRAKVIVQNNVIGSGIGLQAKLMTTRGDLHWRYNDALEAAWESWAEATNCHTGGSLHFCDFERAVMGQVFEAGEVFVRLHRRPFGYSTIPLALELIEGERLADEFQPSAVMQDAKVRLGIETDAFHRPVAYWIRTLHPGELRLTAETTSRIERVPAEDIIHLRVIDRWPQTRGVPWLHAAARRLNDMDGLGEAEIVAARAAACYMGFIESPTGETQYGDEQADGSKIAELEPAMVEHLAPGEKFTYAAPNRPNAQLDPFMRLMLREVAAGVGCSYESLSRDYSQSNYSSSRLSLLDDRDLWRTLQKWFIRSFRVPLHRQWVQAAVLSRSVSEVPIEAYALNPLAYEQVRFKPRGWNWVDPTKEVEAFKEAIRCGFTTVGRVIEQTGNGDDLEDVLRERKEELDLMDEMGLKFESDPVADSEMQADAKGKPEKPTAEKPDEKDGTDPTVEKAEKMLREVPHAH